MVTGPDNPAPADCYTFIKMSRTTVPAEPIIDRARAMGFALVGIAPARPSEHGDYIRQWLAKGRHGTMEYLARHLDVRLDPDRFVTGARTVICTADTTSQAPAPSDDPAAGRIARYAWTDDYHRVMKKRLIALADALRHVHSDHEFLAAVDTAPVLEREHAVAAGLGWIGKHTLLIHPQRGSHLTLGVIVTTLDIAPDHAAPMADHCGTCTRCIDACPTGCISHNGYQLDASRCISYLTIEHRDRIDPSLHPAIGNWLAGCDVCQDVCPHNREVPADDRPPPPAHRQQMNLMDILGWGETARREALIKSALKRIKLDMFKRNALIVAANALRRRYDEALAKRVAEIANDPIESSMVRRTARDVIETGI